MKMMRSHELRAQVRPTAAGLAAFVVDYDETATREADSPRSMCADTQGLIQGVELSRGLELDTSGRRPSALNFKIIPFCAVVKLTLHCIGS